MYKKKYKPGRVIRTISSLNKCTFIYFCNIGPRHIEFVKSLQLRFIEWWLKEGLIRKALKTKQ